MKNGLFRKDEFRYDAACDVYVCPAGEALSRNHESTLRDLKRFHYTNPAACSACPLRVRCITTADRRQVTRLENEAVLDRVAARLKARPWVLDRRREVVEYPFRFDQAMDVSGRPERVNDSNSRASDVGFMRGLAG